MGFLEKKFKKAKKKGKKKLMKELGMKDHKKKKKKHYSSPSPPPRSRPPRGASPPPGRRAPPPGRAPPPSGGTQNKVLKYIDYLQRSDSDKRKKGRKKLKKYFKEDPQAVAPHIPQLISVLRHNDKKVRRDVAKSIRKGAEKSPTLFKKHIEAIRKYLNDPDHKVRERLMDAVERLSALVGGVAPETHVTNIYQTEQKAPPRAPRPTPSPEPAPTPKPKIEKPSEVLESGKPGVHLDIIEEELPYKRWGMIRLKVENHSEVDIYNVEVKVSGPVEISPVDTIHHIPAGKSETLKVGMKAPEAGRVPAHLSAVYYDRKRNEFKHSRQDWVTVEKPKKEPNGTQINIGSIGDIVSDQSTRIHDSVVQRSNIGGGGGASKGGGGKTSIKGSTMQRSTVSGGGDVSVEDSVMMRSQIGGGNKCPSCGNSVEEEWAVCPKCGNKL